MLAGHLTPFLDFASSRGFVGMLHMWTTGEFHSYYEACVSIWNVITVCYFVLVVRKRRDWIRNRQTLRCPSTFLYGVGTLLSEFSERVKPHCKR